MPPSGGPPPWWVELPSPTLEFERVKNRQRAELWRDGRGDGAPVYLRADVARALAELAYDSERPVELILLDDLVDRLLAGALGLDRGLPTGTDPAGDGAGL
ncbi:hypothetical protein BSZ36_05020 [Rubricoccus marinus]|uniref:Uncharacterized protein n=1 Tax=Rubricoccus marinus TaxID=716817 RepID=A0A259TX99_9BACT|nr:hypothetical protein BSZ36_05020 [Rubricoccus marinus]